MTTADFALLMPRPEMKEKVEMMERAGKTWVIEGEIIAKSSAKAKQSSTNLRGREAGHKLR